jgi:hypothetical protein
MYGGASRQRFDPVCSVLGAASWSAAPTIEPPTHLVTQVQEAIHWSQLAAGAAEVAARLATDPTLDGRSRRPVRVWNAPRWRA